MPELPDLTIYLEALATRIVGDRFEGLVLASPFVLRSVAPAATDLAGRKVVELRRLGKRIVVCLENERFIVIHLMVAGRLQFRSAVQPGPEGAGRMRTGGGRNRLAAALFASGELLLTEAGKKHRASIHLVSGEAGLAAHDPGGIEPLVADPATFRQALAAENHTLKRALTDPRLVAGIGNAYSDEILHRARLSPFARTGDLSDESWSRLHAATQRTLAEWIERLRREFAGRFPDKVTAFRPEMAVHGRFGLPCPVCATAVQRIVYAENEANYCPGCQTGGKLLADRVLSRLLHGDWPKSLEELEERKSVARAEAAILQSPRPPRPLRVLALALLAAGTSMVQPLAAAVGVPAPHEPPLGRAVEPPLPLPALQPNPRRLAEARSILAARVHAASEISAAAAGTAGSRSSADSDTRDVGERTLGGYLFLSDLRESALLARAEAVVGGLETVYVERYGRRPVGAPREAIVLFSREEDYRRFQAGDPRLAGLAGSTGLAGSGVVATFQGERSDDELLGTLVHELGHLLNRRAIGPSLPSWLDEGIADDLGASRIDAFGTLVPGSWSRTLEARGGEIRISGGEAALRDLADVFGPDGSAPGRLDLGAILALEWEEFVAPQGAELHYAAAAAFIRMLLAAPAKSTVFRAWLAEVSEGGPPAAEELRRALGRPWDELEPELALWTRGELARLPPLRPAGTRVALPRSMPSKPSPGG